MTKHYNSRVWLNSSQSPSTGSMVCYYGKSSWDEEQIDMFIEVSSCHEIARLHKSRTDTAQQYIAKLRKMQKELSKYIEFLDDTAAK